MPHYTPRKVTQHKALAKQRRRFHRKARLQVALSRVNHEIKTAARKITKRKELIEKAEKPLVHLAGSHEHGCDRVDGGTFERKIQVALEEAAQRSASGERHSFYDQGGGWDVCHGITGESRDKRSDCSQFGTSMFHAVGANDPNGTGYTGGFTGTLADHGRAISYRAARPGDLGFFGTYPFHHVEVVHHVDRAGIHFVGHGSPPVDAVTPGFPDHFRTYH